MAGRLKVYNLSTGAWEYVNTTQALRFIPVASGAWDLNASAGNTAEQVLELATSIPANVPGIVAVSLFGLIRDQATASGAAGGANTTLTVRHYPSGDVAMTAYSGGVGQRARQEDVAPTVDDGEHEEQEDRQDEGEFDQGLALKPGSAASGGAPCRCHHERVI